ncbi:DNA polymerase III subunit alpha [Helicobacter sp. 11S02629-2]|uniref:DNA polymerase III subunit alpha n=1 Tax=Helicobacter sp. 11S02629-2 TaxID=1476195 RepID=UPI000BA5973E|nr:DNA polymerase III subunit alpha [Helicobacter sp. 11S02629-2]PAF45602.1 DNA polymerase III subunit alpha [Helicobacter sp. 11S02629-2]
MSAKFTHLHLHTEFSLLDGANKLDALCNQIKALGMDSVAMSDHGNMFGAIKFYTTMKKAGIKPIIGMEAYIHNKEDLGDRSRTTPRFHLCLFAKDDIGYKNLMYLSSRSFMDGRYFGFPRINKKLLREHSSGLVCSSACLQGEISWHLNTRSERNLSMGARGYEGAKEAVAEYQDIFGEDFYIEIMRHGIREQNDIDDNLIRLSLETGAKLIATNDSHYRVKEDASMQEVAMCIAMGKTLADANRLRHSVHEFYVKSPEEMAELFADLPEALSNTQEIANKCNLEIDLKNNDSNPPTPPTFKFAKECALQDGVDFVDEAGYFRYKCEEGLAKRLTIIDESKHTIYKERLAREMDTIESMKFPGYMLIVWDFINYAKSNKIPVGPGRGSAAGSLVAFCLGITDIDPIKYDLLFERFLNPERVSMPDIDTDFCQRRRGEMFEYMSNRYGRNNVAQVITFGKMLAKSVIRDVARVYDMPYKESDEFAKLIPKELNITLKDAFLKEPKIKELTDANPKAKEVWEMALKLEGLNRNAGIHAAALVIDGEKELWNKVPLYVPEKTKDNIPVTQYSMKHLEEVDLIKFDFLGLKTLTVIQDALDIIAETSGRHINFLEVDANDPEVYKTLQSGNTLGIFQLESNGMQDINKRLRPTCIDDAIALIALYRPGPIESGMTADYIERKHGRAKIEYPFKELESILKPTYGVIVYQEQVMQIVQVIGGFSLGEADLVRRAMGKKDAKAMDDSKSKFVQGAKKNGFDAAKAGALFDLIAKFAEYGFNKSHSAAYGMLVFQTAYLKTYYEHEFMAAMLTSESNKIEAVAKYIDEVKALGIAIANPHVNHSMIDFSVIKDETKDKGAKDYKKIVFGLGAIKGAGTEALKNIIEVRKEGGVFVNFADFVARVDFNKISKRILEPLIKSGSLDDLGYTRRALLENIDYICDMGRAVTRARRDQEGGSMLFAEYKADVQLEFKNVKELDSGTILEYEYESLGFYVSGHPLDAYRDRINATKGIAKIVEALELKSNSFAMFACKVLSVNRKIGKSGKIYGVLNVMDLTGKLEFTVFENQLNALDELNANLEDPNEPICFKCKIEKDDDDENDIKLQVRVLELLSLSEAKNAKVTLKYDRATQKSEIPDTSEVTPLDIKFKNIDLKEALCVVFESNFDSKKLDLIASKAKECEGSTPLILQFVKDGSVYEFQSNLKVDKKIASLLPDFKWMQRSDKELA